MQTPSERLARQRASNRRWRRKLVADGICVRCYQPHGGEGHECCRACRLEKARVARRAYHGRKSALARLALQVFANALR